MSANYTGNKFFQPGNNINNPIIKTKGHEIKEIKSNYYAFAPKYNFENLYIEKLIRDNKQKQLAENRYFYENHDSLSTFGLARAYKKSETERQLNIKRILSNQKYEPKEDITRKDEETKNKSDSLGNKPSYKIITNKIKNMLSPKAEKNEEDISQNEEGLVGLVKNQHEVTMKINITKKNDAKNKLDSLKEKLVGEFNGDKLPELPSEALVGASLLDPLLGVRNLYQKNMDIKQIDLTKTQYSMHYRPLSVFDVTNCENSSNYLKFKPPQRNPNLLKPSTSFDFKTADPEDNPLNRRRLLSGSKQFEINKIKDSLRHKQIQIKDLNNKFIVPDKNEVFYSSFLPIPGVSLKTKEVEKKKK